MQLQSLHLQNFKGIKNLDVELNGKSIEIKGMNATGKTTVFDAYTWLLFGKNSNNEATFNLKTLDENNEPIHNLTHSVTGIFLVDGQSLELRRDYKENWTRTRGSKELSLKGHTTDYFIDQVPVNKGQYDMEVKGLIDPELFKSLSNPLHFMEKVPWQKRRETLFAMVGGVDKEDVIASNDDLLPLVPFLSNKDMDRLRAQLTAEIKRIKHEIDIIPARIDEATRSIPEVKSSVDDLKARKAELRADLKELEAAEVDDTSIKEITAKIRDAKSKLNSLKWSIQEEYNNTKSTLESELRNKKSEATNIERRLNLEKARLEATKKNEADTKAEVERLRGQYRDVQSSTFEAKPDDLICRTCGQKLPDQENLVATMRQKFDTNKAQRLDGLNVAGQKMKDSLEEIKKEKARLNSSIKRLAENQKTLIPEIEEAENALRELKANAPDMDNHAEVIALTDEIAGLESEKQALMSAPVDPRKDEIRDEITEIDRNLAKLEEKTRMENRIHQLEDQLSTLSDELAEKENTQYLCDEYTKSLVSLSEQKINAMFTNITWRLFRDQINGGIAECCDALINGVPYADANNAAKINAGLDFISALSKHVGQEVPVWIDNAEAVNQIFCTGLQVIELRVTEDAQLVINNNKEEQHEQSAA